MQLLAFLFAACVAIHGLEIQGNDETGNRAAEINKMNFVKPAASILHENINVISIGEDESGAVSVNNWKPSFEDIKAAEDVLIDPLNLAVVRRKEQNGKSRLVGVADGKKMDESVISEAPFTPTYLNHSDFIANPANLTYSKKSKAAATPLIVETLIVVDKDFADVFQQDRVKILDYLTVFFWDINMRFKTLPSVDISFRVTGVVIISTTSAQPFIENARDSEGRADLGGILYQFNYWIFDNPTNFPKFDLAVAITNTNLVWGGGIAYMNSNCWNRGTAVWNDGGDWYSITNAAHEIAHTLGAPHDEPSEGCKANGYIMSGGQDNLRWFFSPCSDKYIKDYVTSDQAACLRRIDEPSRNPISSDFSAVLTPTMDQQCKMFQGPTAFIEEKDTANCIYTRCLVPIPGSGGTREQWYYNVENSPCLGGGRCFRGKCRKPDFRVQNVASGQCLKAPNPFAFTILIGMADCPQPGTPYDRFAVNDTVYGKTLSTTWQSVDSEERGDRCMYTGIGEGGYIWTDVCGENPWHGWDFINLGNSEFILRHRVTGRCAKQVGNGIQTFSNCDINDRNMKWKLL